MLNLPLSPEQEARLRDRAAAVGKDLTEYVLDVVNEELEMGESMPSADAAVASTANQWVRDLHAWAAGHPAVGRIVDDSRESIYEGRGE